MGQTARFEQDRKKSDPGANSRSEGCIASQALHSPPLLVLQKLQTKANPQGRLILMAAHYMADRCMFSHVRRSPKNGVCLH